jgi:hypothetical protein
VLLAQHTGIAGLIPDVEIKNPFIDSRMLMENMPTITRLGLATVDIAVNRPSLMVANIQKPMA